MLSVTVVAPAACVTAVTEVPGAMLVPWTVMPAVTLLTGPRVSWVAPVPASALVDPGTSDAA